MVIFQYINSTGTEEQQRIIETTTDKEEALRQLIPQLLPSKNVAHNENEDLLLVMKWFKTLATMVHDFHCVQHPTAGSERTAG